jgi:signal transduction histidine kinase
MRTGSKGLGLAAHAFLSFTNTGPIVPPEQLERLFQPFQRLGDARTHHNNGHGLGLSIVQAIATAHHGELSTRPRAQGGLTIEVSFPPSARAPRDRDGHFEPAAGARSGRDRGVVSAGDRVGDREAEPDAVG